MGVMRKLIVIEFMTLDSVIQAPSGEQEDPSGGFTHGGWTNPYSDAVQSAVIKSQMFQPFDLLVGRRTYAMWATYWPHQTFWPQVNEATKYVVSTTLTQTIWGPAELISHDVPARIAALKQTQGRDLHVYGSGTMVQTLLAHDLVNEFWLKIHPLTLGSGTKLFGSGTIPAHYSVTKSEVTPTGVLMLNLARGQQH
ncbi:MAG: hypothetical protein RLZZ297_2109 [Chloroflexota bacterium]|jgi:dihydrofolate reductase